MLIHFIFLFDIYLMIGFHDMLNFVSYLPPLLSCLSDICCCHMKLEYNDYSVCVLPVECVCRLLRAVRLSRVV